MQTFNKLAASVIRPALMNTALSVCAASLGPSFPEKVRGREEEEMKSLVRRSKEWTFSEGRARPLMRVLGPRRVRVRR